MRKFYVWLMVIMASIAIIIAVALLRSNKKDYLFIGDDESYFGMSRSMLIQNKGEPVEVSKDVSDTLLDEYIYTEEISGYSAHCSYLFSNSRLIEVCITIDGIGYDAARAMVKTITDEQKKYYSCNSGYYCSEDVMKSSAQFIVSNGVCTGATGISFEYSYSSGSLTINAVKQD